MVLNSKLSKVGTELDHQSQPKRVPHHARPGLAEAVVADLRESLDRLEYGYGIGESGDFGADFALEGRNGCRNGCRHS